MAQPDIQSDAPGLDAGALGLVTNPMAGVLSQLCLLGWTHMSTALRHPGASVPGACPPRLLATRRRRMTETPPYRRRQDG